MEFNDIILNYNVKTNNINLPKNKEVTDILQSILKKFLDKKLINLEKNTKKHLTTLNIASSTTKYINNLTSTINKRLKNKKENKINKFSKSVKKLNLISNKFKLKEYSSFSNNRSASKRSIIKSEVKNNKILQRFQTESKRINLNIYNKSKPKENINKRDFIYKTPIKLKKYINSSNNQNNPKRLIIYHTRNHKSLDSNISNKNSSIDNTSYMKNSRNNKKIGLIGRLKRSIDKLEDKNTINKKRNRNKFINTSKKNSTKNINEKTPKKKKFYSINKDKIIHSLEENWKKEENVINKDPLLIRPMTDLEFIPKELKTINISREELSTFINKNKDTSFKVKDSNEKNIKDISIQNYFKFENTIFGENLPNILVFLSKADIFQLKNCSKYFNSFIINYFIKILDKEKINFLEKQNKLNLKEDEFSQKLDLKNLNLNRSTLRAINLLNDEIFCRLFFEEKKPNKEILIVYKLYFQIINYKEIINLYNKQLSDDIFWEKCRNYFQKYNGNISEILINNIKNNKILLTGENLYKVYKLIEKDLYKFNSGYFSKLCGTTGIFIFYIRNILDFLGFTNEKKFQKNSYCSFLEIINYIDYKINMLNSFSLKFLSN